MVLGTSGWYCWCEGACATPQVWRKLVPPVKGWERLNTSTGGVPARAVDLFARQRRLNSHRVDQWSMGIEWYRYWCYLLCFLNGWWFFCINDHQISWQVVMLLKLFEHAKPILNPSKSNHRQFTPVDAFPQIPMCFGRRHRGSRQRAVATRGIP